MKIRIVFVIKLLSIKWKILNLLLMHNTQCDIFYFPPCSICLCYGLAVRWSTAAGRRISAEAGERVPSTLSCLYKTAVRLRARTFAWVSYPLSIDFPPFVLSTGAWVLPRVRLVNFHDFFLCLKREARMKRRYTSSWFVSWPIVFVHSDNVVKLYFIGLFIVVASSLRNVFAFKIIIIRIVVGKNWVIIIW